MRAKALAPFLCLGLLVTGCSIDLQHGLSEQDANDIYVLLNENGISARKDREEGGNEPTYRISVARQDASQAARLLRDNSLPRPITGGFRRISDHKGMIPTQVEERAMFLEAIAGEVSGALNKVDGVLDSKVIVMIPERSDLTQPDKKPLPSASVFVKYRQMDGRPPPLDEHLVKKFVATAVEDLRPEQVTVILSPAQPPSSELNPDSQIKDVFGLRMVASSVLRFQAMVALASLAILVLAAFGMWNFIRPAPVRPRRP